MKFKKRKQKQFQLTTEQKEVITWVFEHYIEKKYDILATLLLGKGMKFPEKVVSMYKSMSEKEQNQIVLILTRYYNDSDEKMEIENADQLISHYSYL